VVYRQKSADRLRRTGMGPVVGWRINESGPARGEGPEPEPQVRG
jgi:hypothetical protein